MKNWHRSCTGCFSLQIMNSNLGDVNFTSLHFYISTVLIFTSLQFYNFTSVKYWSSCTLHDEVPVSRSCVNRWSRALIHSTCWYLWLVFSCTRHQLVGWHSRVQPEIVCCVIAEGETCVYNIIIPVVGICIEWLKSSERNRHSSQLRIVSNCFYVIVFGQI